MVFQSWHLVVVAVFVALVVWGFRVSQRRMLLASAATLVFLSGWLLYTLVLEESNLDQDLNARLDVLAFVGIPAVLGVSLGVLALKGARSRHT